jgi:hypothetical protein
VDTVGWRLINCFVLATFPFSYVTRRAAMIYVLMVGADALPVTSFGTDNERLFAMVGCNQGP